MKTISEITKHFPNIEFSDKYLEVLKELESNENACINVIGNAGSGKSTLLGIIHYAFENENIVTCATTGVASALLNASHPEVKATTVHSTFGLKAQTIFSSTPDYIKPQIREVIENMDILIIDEISMANCSLLDQILRIIFEVKRSVLKEMPRVVLFGDVLQLPPVINTRDNIIKNFFDDEYEGKYFYFNSKCFKKMNPKIVQLSKVYRQEGDSSFKDVLNRIRVNKATEDDLKLINSRVVDECEFMAEEEVQPLRIVSTNSDVNLYNKVGLDMLDTKEKCIMSTFVNEYEVKKCSDYNSELYPDSLIVKEGAQVMITRNSPDKKEFVNGDIGILQSINNNEAKVLLSDGRLVIVPRMKTEFYKYDVKDNVDEKNVKTKKVNANVIGSYENIPLKIAFAVTVWKSQGQTIKRGIIDLKWCPQAVIYVALSRFRNINSFCLTRILTMNDIKVDFEALEWLNNLDCTICDDENKMINDIKLLIQKYESKYNKKFNY